MAGFGKLDRQIHGFARADFADQVVRQFSIALPTVPNTTARGDALMAFWLGPRSWLLVAESTGPPLADFVKKRDAMNAAGGALFQNQGGGHFQEVTDAALGRTSWGGMGARFFDANEDEWPDLFVVDMHSDMWTKPENLDAVRASEKFNTPLGTSVAGGRAIATATSSPPGRSSASSPARSARPWRTRVGPSGPT